jgi:hypothetical protein
MYKPLWSEDSAGIIDYYYVTSNTRAVQAFARQVARILLKGLNRKSQRRSLTWEEYNNSWIKLMLVTPGNPKPL